MEHLQAWIGTAPLLLALLGLLYLPGLLVLALARVRRNLAIGLAPAITCGLVGVGGIALDLLGVRWGRLSFLAVVAAACLLVLAYRWLLHRWGTDRRPLGGEVAGPRGSTAQHLAIAGAVLVAVLLHWIPVLVVVDPGFPSALTDPMFHYNGIHAVMSTGNASMFGAMDWNHGLRVLETTYPAVWHALAALVAGPGTTLQVAHVLALLVTPVVFLVGITCLGAEAFPRRREMMLLAPLVAAGFAAFPDYMTAGKGFWPNALALALLPGVLAVMIAVIIDASRGRLARNWVRYLGSVLVLLAGIAGMVLSHPTLLFTLLWVCAPGIAVVVFRLVRRLWRVWPRSRFLAAALLMAALGAVVLVVVLSHPQVQASMSRPVTGTWTAFLPRLTSTLVLWSTTPNPLVLCALLLFYGSVFAVAVAFAIRSRRSRWVLAAWAMQTLLVLGVYFPLPGLSSIAGIWYADAYRLFAIQVVFLALLLSMALSMAWTPSPAHGGAEPAVRWPAALERVRPLAGHRAARGLVAAVLVVHLALGGFLSWRAAYAPAAPAIGQERIISSPQELELLEELDELVPEGSVVLGDPLSGIGYAPVLGDVDSVFTQFTTRSLDRDGTFLAEHFADIHEDVRVCTVLRHYGIGYYYEDEPVQYEGESREIGLPGLYDVDTSEGFTPIASADGATLWRVDACGEIDPREDWWQEDWRGGTVTGR
ncbi:hypothetical protein FM106_05440 [Brachybacterium faecium]|uniref:Uncharacterized protein n=1 Tax=Brachybacterium faecium (strain ATCC 43885 / DSM 4810 / JCM 11609 / LMG 19847 / NBRC 14762 / NCIMB 9860 / 6-10) TaxID=446465 RepID=C7ME97_BRAFD|nr:DUF6541 family protein [Brachybacterium faecium]ACU85904.1 hypothetical protein Bfae_20970 [Brachybacterium faecium DSM 4810]SLM92824.1 hypothetical protein FM106_05440 [Brachybacterium faecium]HJG51879.1 hypothetical protein [Brachybacterium faecium]